MGTDSGFHEPMLHAAHHRMRQSIEAYIDGELGVPARAAVEVHLDGCWGCSSYAETLQLMKRSLRRVAERRPADLTTARLRRWAGSLVP